MLFLLFELDGERYALDATRIVEVLALAPVKSMLGTPPWLTGVIDHRGKLVPVIDVPRLALGRAAHALRSTRLVVVRYAQQHEADGVDRWLGLIVEHATQVREFAPAQFADSGIATPHARWLGPVAADATGFVQRIDVEQMLDDDARALLFPPAQALAG
ncbi:MULTISPECIES: chemotaxis protein CheW [unclassified Burkholderia]|uniref:chemotaxis protein CheW n=1 Tax=unclassified Burkholderia TaxID=2613784 RepID=UPI0005CDEFE2|nr:MULTISPECIES: chemotaxis protein CheW [unclassified Burkholderia]TGN98234.1 purine-binding chemotaxis protein CheW [Burkholderia sp. USMB20]